MASTGNEVIAFDTTYNVAVNFLEKSSRTKLYVTQAYICAFKYNRFDRCFKCLDFGHTKSRYPIKKADCSKCAKLGHTKLQNLRHDHDAQSLFCPVFKAILREASRARVGGKSDAGNH